MANSQDEEHLQMLSIFHYVVGGLTALIGCFPLIHVAVGMALFLSPRSFHVRPNEGLPPTWFGLLFVIFGGAIFLGFQSLAGCVIAAGRFLSKRTRYLFIFVTACVQCAFFPFGTALGVFTIIVLSRDSVKLLFGRQVAPAAPSPSPPQTPAQIPPPI